MDEVASTSRVWLAGKPNCVGIGILNCRAGPCSAAFPCHAFLPRDCLVSPCPIWMECWTLIKAEGTVGVQI